MRFLVLTATLLLAGSAIADDKHKPLTATKQLDKSSPMLAPGSDDGTDASDDTRAQDYNSSRSNTTSAVDTAESDVSDGNEKDSDVRCDEDSDCGDRGADAQDYNSSRSNNTNGG